MKSAASFLILLGLALPHGASWIGWLAFCSAESSGAHACARGEGACPHGGHDHHAKKKKPCHSESRSETAFELACNCRGGHGTVDLPRSVLDWLGPVEAPAFLHPASHLGELALTGPVPPSARALEPPTPPPRSL